MARYDDDDDVFDTEGLLKDGRMTRVPLMMRDGLLSPLQRAVMADRAARVVFDDSQAKPGPGYCDAAGRRRKAEAYEAMVRDMCSAWRTSAATDAGVRGQKPGDQCTIDGAPGHLNAKLECAPDQQDARPVYDAAASRRIKAAAYQQMVDEMTSAWKGPTR